MQFCFVREEGLTVALNRSNGFKGFANQNLGPTAQFQELHWQDKRSDRLKYGSLRFWACSSEVPCLRDFKPQPWVLRTDPRYAGHQPPKCNPNILA